MTGPLIEARQVSRVLAGIVPVTLVLMVGVCIVASVLALMRLRQLEPAMVFR